MSDAVLLIASLGCIFLAVLFLMAALRRRQRTSYTFDRREKNESDALKGMRIFGALLRPDSEAALSELKNRTVQAGLYGQDAIDLFLTVRMISFVSGIVAAVGIFSWLSNDPGLALLTAVGIAGVGVIGPSVWLQRRAQERQAEVNAALPPTIDLLVVCLEAGLGLEQALERVVRVELSANGKGDLLRRELALVLSDMRVGMPVEQAFHRMADRIGSEDVNTVAALIGRAARLGAKMGQVLRGHADSVRRHQMITLEEMTGKANAKLALPLALFLLPAALLVMAGPAFVNLMRTL